jgi:hypothetical protein
MGPAEDEQATLHRIGWDSVYAKSHYVGKT